MTSRTQRVLTVLFATGGLLIVSWAILIGAILFVGGVATVQWVDRNEGLSLHVPIPMALVTAAASAAGAVMPDDRIELHGDFDLGEWTPFVEEMLKALDDCPDVTLVEVIDRGEVVRVSKRGGKLEVEVDADDLRFQVAVPTRSIRYTVGALLD